MKSPSLLILISFFYLFKIVLTQDLVFIILNEKKKIHLDSAYHLKGSLINSSTLFDELNVTVHVATDDFPQTPSWIYLPLMTWLNNSYASKKDWFIFLPESTRVNLTVIHKLITTYSQEEPYFIGRALEDDDPSIIHHFDSVDASSPFIYPDLRTGFFINNILLTRIVEKMTPSNMNNLMDFSIDAEYEFAKWIKSTGTALTHDPAFCIEPDNECAVTHFYRTCVGTTLNDVFFGIKTCQNFHKERIPILRSTWLPTVTKYTLYSDVADKEYGTISSGIANTERGHCAKTLHIIKEASKRNDIKWLFIADDDTLLSADRLLSLLSCYNSSDVIALGQRYGMSLLSESGFDYLTGGAGMAFSLPLVKVLAQPRACECGAPDVPDDMHIGMCLTRFRIPIIHSHLFHQARPDDYAEDLLRGSKPISFHKYWMIDPIQRYKQWLSDEDYNTPHHIEL